MFTIFSSFKAMVDWESGTWQWYLTTLYTQHVRYLISYQILQST